MRFLALSLIFLIPNTNAFGAEPFETYGKCFALYVKACDYGCWDEDGNAIPSAARLAQTHVEKASVMLGYARNSSRYLSGLDAFDAGSEFGATAGNEEERMAVLSALDGKPRAEEYRLSKIDSLKCDYLR